MRRSVCTRNRRRGQPPRRSWHNSSQAQTSFPWIGPPMGGSSSGSIGSPRLQRRVTCGCCRSRAIASPPCIWPTRSATFTPRCRPTGAGLVLDERKRHISGGRPTLSRSVRREVADIERWGRSPAVEAGRPRALLCGWLGSARCCLGHDRRHIEIGKSTRLFEETPLQRAIAPGRRTRRDCRWTAVRVGDTAVECRIDHRTDCDTELDGGAEEVTRRRRWRGRAGEP